MDGEYAVIDTFLIRRNADPAEILKKGSPTWPDNRDAVYSLYYAEVCYEFAGPISTVCHCARAKQLLLKKFRSGGEPLATLCPIWLAWYLNPKPPDPETKLLPLDLLTDFY